jgi:hypothetical protein
MGDHRSEHLFVLRQSLAAYRYCQRLLQECDREIHTILKTFDSRVDVKRHPLPAERAGRRKPRHNGERGAGKGAVALVPASAHRNPERG